MVKTTTTTAEVRLRAVEYSDLDILYQWENDQAIWSVSDTVVPFSRHLLEKYIASTQEQDIFSSRQLRLMVEVAESKEVVGMVDLYDFDPLHQRAGVGILIHREKQQQGFGKKAVEKLIDYCRRHLPLHQLYCCIEADNESSIKVFIAAGFKLSGCKKEWLRRADHWSDELMFQYLF